MSPDKSNLNISLTPELLAAISARVASGQYRSASEVVRAALRGLDRADAAPAVRAGPSPFEPFPLPDPAPAPRNRLLRALPPEDLRLIAARMDRVPLKPKRVLHHAGLPIGHVYFIESGLVSVVGAGDDGHSVEAALIGSEGMAGAPVVLGIGWVPHRRIVQAEGEALRMTTSDLHRAMEIVPALRTVVLRHVNYVMLQACQTAVCLARHTLPERLACWLLMAQDRLRQDELPFTHDIIAKLVGVRRSGVTVALQKLVEAQAVANERSRVRVLDRSRLEHLSCSCYRVTMPAFSCMGEPVDPRGRPEERHTG